MIIITIIINLSDQYLDCPNYSIEQLLWVNVIYYHFVVTCAKVYSIYRACSVMLDHLRFIYIRMMVRVPNS